LFTRAPCTRIRPWLSASCSAGDCVFVLVFGFLFGLVFVFVALLICLDPSDQPAAVSHQLAVGQSQADRPLAPLAPPPAWSSEEAD
jgi:hypothetical protein